MALRPCAQPGCPALVTRGRCVVHSKQQDQARGTAQQRGYDARWAEYSRQFRAAHPICGERHDGTLDPTHSRCLREGRLTPAECVDHIRPVSRGGDFWNPENHQSLCLADNSAKGDRV